MRKPPWYSLLEQVRKLSLEGEIHSFSLGKASGMEPADASAWLCKMTRWGYLERDGRSERGGKTVRYKLTDYGRNVKAPKVRREFKRTTSNP
jgi:hypothetical protein